MIRAENTITSLLTADSLITQDDKRVGNLLTYNMFSGTVPRRDLASPGYICLEKIPEWVATEKYSGYSCAPSVSHD